MKIKTFRNIEIEVRNSLEVYVPISEELGLPDLVEIESFDLASGRCWLIDREDSKSSLDARKIFISNIQDKEIFYFSLFENQNIFQKAIRV